MTNDIRETLFSLMKSIKNLLHWLTALIWFCFLMLILLNKEEAAKMIMYPFFMTLFSIFAEVQYRKIENDLKDDKK